MYSGIVTRQDYEGYVRNFIKISRGNNKFQGTLESLEHLMDLLSAMRINMEDIR